MSYDDLERSVEGSSPVELYKFIRGGYTWYFTSAEYDVVFGMNTYLSRSLKRSSIEATQEQARSALTIDTTSDFEISDLFRITAPTDVIAVIVTRYHDGDAGAAVLWTGRLLNVTLAGDTSKLNCEPATSSLGRTGLRRLYGLQCALVLYACGISKDDHKIETTVTAISGGVISVAALLSRPYGGGWIETSLGSGQVERRFIRSFSGLDLTLSLPFQNIEVGAAVTVFPGCDHTTATCADVYNNLPNYGGFPFTPQKNPFDGTPIY